MKFILALFLVLIPAVAFAGPFLVSDAYLPADGLINFKVSMDAGAYVDSPPVANALRYDMAPTTVGAHTIKVKACDIWGCSVDSSPLAFTRPVSLSPPVNLRLSP